MSTESRKLQTETYQKTVTLDTDTPLNLTFKTFYLFFDQTGRVLELQLVFFRQHLAFDNFGCFC